MSYYSHNETSLAMSGLAFSVAPLNDRVTLSSPFAVDASFQFVNVRDLGTIDSLTKHTRHDVVNRVTADFQ